MIQCKMCGGSVILTPDRTIGVCEYCNSTNTYGKISDEQRAAAFNRGNGFRRAGEFDNALAAYEQILRDDDTDAEAHWCAALCRFGIEYVEDPDTLEWFPTCHRASFDSFLEDVDYLAALEHSDGVTRRQYRKDAAKIAEVQKGILATSQNEEPYDVFICYKETGEDGQRTPDSILAQEIYYQLTERGHRVFFSRITLEGKGGAEYEPYIFAALNSAKVMVAVGTKPEHFSAVWVRNEWSRFLALMRKDRSKTLLPCYRDMDPYHLPEQLKILQSYDMGKIGFLQDLIHGVDKVVRAEKKPAVTETVVVQQGAATNVTALIKRGYMALEDGDWKQADDFFEQALNQNAELAEAYLGKFLASKHSISMDDFRMIYLAKTEKAATVKKEVCPDNKDTINEAIRKYMVPGFLDAPAIRAVFDFTGTYESTLDSRKKHLDEIQKCWKTDKNLLRAVQFGDTVMRGQIEECLSAILSVLKPRIDDAVAKDSANVGRITKRYEQHLESAHSRLQKNNVEAKAAYSQQVYEQAIHLVEQSSDVSLLERLYGVKPDEGSSNTDSPENVYLRAAEIMESIPGYLDSDHLAKEYRTRASNIQKEDIYRQATQCSFFLPSEEDLKKAIMLFESILDYKDSAERIKECKEKLTKKQKEALQSTYRSCGLCQHCGGSFTGIWKPRCSSCGRARDY